MLKHEALAKKTRDRIKRLNFSVTFVSNTIILKGKQGRVEVQTSTIVKWSVAMYYYREVVEGYTRILDFSIKKMFIE